MLPWQRFGQHQHMHTRRSPFRTRAVRAWVAGAHRAIAFEVGHVFGAEALDDIVAGSGVGGILEDERIAEDAVFAVDVDGDFAGAWLAGRAGALVAEADGTGGFHGEGSLKSAWRVASPYRPPGGEPGWEESLSDRDPKGRRPATGFVSGGKPRVERGPKGGRPTSEASPSSGGGLGVSPIPHQLRRSRRPHSRDRRAG